MERIFGVLPVTDRRLKRLNRALLVLKVRKACRVFPVLRDSRALRVRRAHKVRQDRRVIPARPAPPPFDQCKRTAQSIATLAKH